MRATPRKLLRSIVDITLVSRDVTNKLVFPATWRSRFARLLPRNRDTRVHSYGPVLMRSLRVFLASHPLPHLLSSFQLPFLFLLLSFSFVLHSCTQVTWE